MLDTYLTCRQVEMVIFKRQISANAAEHVLVRWPSGFAQLPRAGGLDDQPAWTMDIMQDMLDGERKGAIEAASKRRA